MNHPEDLYTRGAAALNVPPGLHLVAGLTGFADAGAAVAQITEALLADVAETGPFGAADSFDATATATDPDGFAGGSGTADSGAVDAADSGAAKSGAADPADATTTGSSATDGEPGLVVEFDPDILLDYRARRPVITFDRDHIAEVRPSRLTLRLLRDELGQPFLFLSGYEPDFQWNRFVRAVVGLAEEFQVADTTWIQSIPMPVPHTRPIGITVSGTRQDLVESMSVWKPQTQAPANVLHLVEHRLTELERAVTGLVLLVPHYLSDTEYPDAAVAALSGISSATGLIFPTDVLRESGRDFLSRVDEQVSGNTELERLVEALEERHDTYMQGNPLASPLTGVDGQVPTADAIAAELERFLADRRSDDGPDD